MMVYYPYNYYFDTKNKSVVSFSINKVKIPTEYINIGRFYAHEKLPYYNSEKKAICRKRYGKEIILKSLERIE